ncbi:hypothetical protein BFP72_16760 [Reichenbachiella sp. 5M10]|uniref:DUF4350 domain-containing protein n=1 Tax=Reichenbachiella sp. 5M10 TaxID=1889772 RepID=UPI000C14D037|nr:DUF4350 domain-containing protein [Reichenbachiella sp. 5M10]PIB36936.1 hypothetical protein BFP72_16760 [Reichenbachiella sp. 5M10]
MDQRPTVVSKGSILYIVAISLLLLLAMGGYERPTNWTKTYASVDQNPYGAYALSELAPSMFQEWQMDNHSFYEVLRRSEEGEGLLSISEDLVLGDPSYEELVAQVSQGKTVLLSTSYLDQKLVDTLSIYFDTRDYYYDSDGDSSFLEVEGMPRTYFLETEILQYIDSLPPSAVVYVTNAEGQAVVASIPFGEGEFVLCSTPIIFTNYFMLYGDNHRLTARVLSLLPDSGVRWTSYYQSGVATNSSPFREVLKHPPLRNALYFALALIALHMIVGSRRVQRAIPVIRALPNQTMDFIKTVGLLYFHQRDQRAVAKSRIDYFKENIRMQYHAHLHQDNDRVLAAKIGVKEEDVTALVKVIQEVEGAKAINDELLIALDKKLNVIYKKSTKR